MSVLTARGLTKRYGERVIFRDASLALARGERVGVVGPNGCGKSTLLRLLAGADEADAGRVAVARGVRVGLVEQEVAPQASTTAEAYLLAARARLDALAAQMRSLEPRLHEPEALRRYGELSDAFAHAGGYDFDAQVARVLGGLGLGAIDPAREVATLSGGERGRLALARLLLEDPDVLLLDEPTNHLDLAGLEWLERFLLERGRAAMLATHDRYLLDRVTARTLAFVDGTVRAYRGAYSAFARQRGLEDEARRRVHERQRAEIARQSAFIERERAGQRARQARGRAKQLARLERVSEPKAPAAPSWRLSAAPLGSDWVLEATPLTVGHAAPLLRAPALRVARGSRVAIVGPNASGKTTLLRTLLGELPALAGHVRAAPGARVAALAQAHEVAAPGVTVLEAFRASSGWSEQESRDLLARFLFRGEDVFGDLGTLSGGERQRIALALVAAREANLLVLDEPTNHLDLPSREALEEVLAAYEGTVVFVTHDRYLVDRLASEVWLIERGGLSRFEGGYSAMRAVLARQEREPSPGRKGDAAVAGGRARRPAPGGDQGGARSAERRLGDMERRIGELERRLADLAERVAEIAQAGNFLEARRAGEEYAEVERALRELYEEWSRTADQR